MIQEFVASSSTPINKKFIVPQLIFDENTRLLLVITGSLLCLLAIGWVFRYFTKI